MAPREQNILREKAAHYFEQGNLTQALKLYTQLKEVGDLAAEEKCEACQLQLLRKYWRQAKPDSFTALAQEMQVEAPLQLALCRLQGKEALEKLALENQTLPSLLAHYFLHPEVKNALQAMRQAPGLRDIAEGWLAILKGDASRASESFAKACGLQPARAKIGLGVAFLLQGEMEQAQTQLSHLRPFAVKHMPILAKAMAWDVPAKETPLNALPVILNGTLPELKAFERLLPQKERVLRGWLGLRTGDRSMKDYEEALRLWTNAEKMHPQLSIDVAKRKFLTYVLSDRHHDAWKYYRILDARLRASFPGKAREFIEYLVFEAPVDYMEKLARGSFCEDDQWSFLHTDFKSIDVEIKLLYLQVIFVYNIKERLLILYRQDVDPEYESHSNWNFWENLFKDLDRTYARREKYLQSKLGIALFFSKDLEVRQTICQLLHGNPLLKDELLPTYVAAALRQLKSGGRDVATLDAELDGLYVLFPSDFDIIRLKILTSMPKGDYAGLSAQYRMRLSEPLYAVLRLQLCADEGKSFANCQSAVPAEHLHGRDREADWRLLAARLAFDYEDEARDLFVHLCKLAPDNQSKHACLSKLAPYEQVSENLWNLLQRWQEAEPEAWQPAYHLINPSFALGRRDMALRLLKDMYEKIPEGYAYEEGRALETETFYEETEYEETDSFYEEESQETMACEGESKSYSTFQDAVMGKIQELQALMDSRGLDTSAIKQIVEVAKMEGLDSDACSQLVSKFEV